MMLRGACHCGTCRYALDADTLDDVANCHCTICRRTTGATLVTWATLPRAKFRWTAGTPARYRSSAPSLRYFCANCGAQLAFEHADWPGTIDITTATLEHPERFPPTRHIWMTTHLPWMPLGDLARADGEP
ncbi:MAG: GFA family protein [Sterolibacteriaceae bacterium]|nr:GFA family protein [Candidatus Methylophosphatis haderslevensis]